MAGNFRLLHFRSGPAGRRPSSRAGAKCAWSVGRDDGATVAGDADRQAQSVASSIDEWRGHMGSNRVRRVVIAGGGTAGWIAASALAYQFRDLIDITLVESSKIGTVGVGESTVPTIQAFHRFLNIDEQEFLREAAGAFKLSISFENWRRPGERYIHPFGLTGKGTLVCPFHHFWLDSVRRGMNSELGDYCLETVASRGDKFALLDGVQVNYAYHLDAALYTRFLRKKFEKYGIKHVEGKIHE